MPTADIVDYVKVCSTEAVKQACQNKIDIYRDSWDYIIEEELSLQFTPETYENLYWLKTKELNILKRVVNELSLIYKTPPIREVYTETMAEGETITKSDENYKLATQGTNKNECLKAVNKYTNLINHSVLHIAHRNGKLDYQIYNFNNIEVFYDREDWMKIVAIKYYVGLSLPMSSDLQTSNPKKLELLGKSSDTISVYKTQTYDKAYIWTAEYIDDSDNNIIVNDNIKYLEAEKIYEIEASGDKKTEHIVEEKDNSLRYEDGRIMLPFVIYDRLFPVDTRFDFSSGNDLVDLNINVAIQKVLLNQIMKYQSFKQIVVTGADPDKLPSPMFTDPQQAMAFQAGRDGESVTVQVLDLQAQIDVFQKVIQQNILDVITGYGISPQNYTMSGNPSSGYSLMISNMGKLEARQDQIEMYRVREKEIYEIERAIWNMENPDKIIDVKAKFYVDFPEPKYPQTAQEKAAEYAYKKMYNAITDIDIIMAENPDLSREEAEIVYKENKPLNTRTAAVQPITQPVKQNGQR